MLKIGDFARLSQVSVKTLRFYAETGLLPPAAIDRFSGYRYYTFEQLPRLNRILALKDLGLSLEQIGQLLDEGLSPDQLRGMLRLKQAELRQRLEDEHQRLQRVEARLRQIEMETEAMTDYAIITKQTNPQWVASVRGIIPSYPEQGGLWHALESDLGQRGIQPAGACFTIYHAEEPEIDAEVCEPLSAPAAPHGPVQVYELPGLPLAASVIHHGPFAGLPQAYEALLKWIEANGYQVTGACREFYLQPPAKGGDQHDPQTVTEIQFPVAKV